MLSRFRHGLSVDMTSMQIKCRGSFMTKMNVGTNEVLTLLHDKVECWHGFVVKTLDAATLQRLLKWLR